ncbi:Biuret hydrolase [Hartmannibacter diazotrophicus]|uniref:Biuret hydrolase n=1 Tax=Hartmannibacter diazotrophicus TaxID=1482074 RepID=A0A2C9D9M5_9HYPH|nr:AtzE family amidohydrolase [Hartmannibacter diazotrophicus]SON56933.1 Biuret hydrolase [Hartmannibacter diazotrophicus]
MSMDLLHQSGAEIASAVKRREVSARDIAIRAIETVSAIDEKLHAFTDVTADRALAEADAVDAMIAKGQAPVLAGVPYAVKNLYDIEGVTTRAGSRINRDNPPAAADATLISKLKTAGALLIGGLNMGEYAYDFTGENIHDGNALNPHDPGRMSGGSSGGSGTAVASGMVPVALGSDTNGSIRVPASFCGLFGLKPTFGRLSRVNTFPFVANLDHLGPMARSAEDLALVFDAMQGHDPLDHWQAKKPILPTVSELKRGTDGLRIAVAGDYFRKRQMPEASAAVDLVAKALGATEEVVIPEALRARSAAYVITNAESSGLHLKQLQARAADYDPDTRDRFIAGAFVPGAWVVAAHRFRTWFREEMRKMFETVDVILAPATPFHAPKSGTKTVVLDGEELPARANIGIFTQPISFIGLPVVAVPVWLDGAKLPIGVQVIAPAWREDIALRVAHQLQMDGIARAPVAMIA